jgi:hypothetical protein
MTPCEISFLNRKVNIPRILHVEDECKGTQHTAHSTPTVVRLVKNCIIGSGLERKKRSSMMMMMIGYNGQTDTLMNKFVFLC